MGVCPYFAYFNVILDVDITLLSCTDLIEYLKYHFNM